MVRYLEERVTAVKQKQKKKAKGRERRESGKGKRKEGEDGGEKSGGRVKLVTIDRCRRWSKAMADKSNSAPNIK